MAEQFQTWLFAERRATPLLAVAALIGFAFGLYVLGWEGITGSSEYWSTTHDDSVQSIAALRYYMDEGWAWPLFEVRSYGYPEGTNLALTGSIPLLAVLAKAMSGILPAGFHYFGYWIAFCFMMQAVAMTALLRLLGRRSYAAVFVGSGLAMLQTVFLARYVHASLMGQFLITLTLVAGVAATRSKRPAREMTYLGLLAAVAFVVQIYLFVMVVVLAAAFVLGLYGHRIIGWRSVLSWMGAVGFTTLGLAVASGLTQTSTAPSGGFGTYSSNLLSLFVADPNGTGGQYEGRAYLGLGVIVLLAVALYAGRPQIRSIFRTYRIPVIAVLLMAVYALSTDIYLGDRLLLALPEIGLVEWVGERFRSSGRFVWPLVYALVATVIVVVWRRFDLKTVTILMAVVLALQAVDMADTVSSARQGLGKVEAQVLNTANWTTLIERHTLVRMTPHSCVVGTGNPAFASREIQRLSANAGIRVTTTAAAAQATRCDDPAFREPLAPGELRVVWSQHDDSYEIPQNQQACMSFSLGTVCTLQVTTLPADGGEALDQALELRMDAVFLGL